MGKLWKLAYANIRKTKSVSITLAALFMLSALLINSGLMITLNYGSYYNDLKKELNSSDAYIYMSDSCYNEDVKTYINNNEHIKKYETNDVICLGGQIQYGDNEKSITFSFNNMDKSRGMSKWKFVGDHEDAEDMGVYVPDVLNAVGHYKINDKIKITYDDINTRQKKELVFTVKGYIEDIFFSSTDTGIMGMYVNQATYDKLAAQFSEPAYKGKVIYTNLDEVKNASKIESGIRNVLGMDSSSMMSGDSAGMILAIDTDLISLSRCSIASVLSSMMVVFSLVIVIVCLLVVRFRIKNTLQDDIMKFGSLKSIGYTNGQIRTSILLQFLSIAGIGSLFGIILTYPCMPSIEYIFEQQSGLKWVQGFDPLVNIIALVIILLIVTITVLAVAGKIKKLSPVSALRGVVTESKFKKNRLPLEKTKSGLVGTLAMKTSLQNVKQNIMIMIIVAAVTFAGVFGVIMYYNSSVDTSIFQKVPGMEICNVVATVDKTKDNTEIINKIRNMDEVDLIQFIDESKVNIDNSDVSVTIMSDYSEKRTNLVYKGNYPKNKDDILLAGILAKRLDKKIGDTVTVKAMGKTMDLKVCGLSNGSQMGGINCSMLEETYKEFNPDFSNQVSYIYLKKGNDTQAFIDKLKTEFTPKELISISNFDKLMAEGMLSYQNIVSAMGIAMLVITIFVVVLVLYFVISSTISRKKRELGIQKAIGFTTIQLMNQVTLEFMLPVFIGVLVGSVLGVLLTNPMMSASMSGIGMMKAEFIISPLYVIAFSLGILLLSYILSMLITARIRKISAYALVTE